MYAYAEMANAPWMKTVPRCLMAAVGDAVITVGILLIYTLVMRKYPGEFRWNDYALLATLSAFFAIGLEELALFAGRWSYTSRMATLPGIGIGISPVLQLALLVPIATRLTEGWQRAWLHTD